MKISGEAARYREELQALAEGIPFKQVALDQLKDKAFVPTIVRQPRTYVPYDRGAQAVTRFLVEQGTVEVLSGEQITDLFTEIQWCAYQVRRLSRKRCRDPGAWRALVIEARRLVSRMEAAEEELFIANRRLIVRCVKPYFWVGEVWLSDFLQEGSKALSNAIRKFDFTRGAPFYSYAQKAIQNRLRNYFRDHVRAGSIGLRPTHDMTRVKNAIETWTKIHGKEPDNEELARMTGMLSGRVGQVRAFVKQYEHVPTPPVSLDAMLGDSTTNLHDMLEDVDAEVAPEAAQLAEIWTAIERLPERSRYIMRLRFVEGRTLEETGDALHLTRARIKQIQDDSLRRIREMLHEGVRRTP